MSFVKNPVLPGFYPDPSICRAEDTFYLVNSTFSYFPGVPVFSSRDLKHFHQVGNILDRASQLPLEGARMSQGIFAPTIRYHNGTFYMITTNVSGGGNFIVTAAQPEGPWSEPHYLAGAEGIDPSIFFDEDGKCYYIGTRPNPDGVRYNGDWYIYIQELDIENFSLKGCCHLVWKGAMRDAEWPEGPHLYKKDGYYYIIHAEGGTGPAHAVSAARSEQVFGPYVGHFHNPIITHRQMGRDYPVRYVGHADLVDTPDGDWYMVMLASRPCEGHTGLGRETFLAKVTWEDGWPVVNAGIGHLTERVEIGLPEEECIPQSSLYTFDREKLQPQFVTVRNPKPDMYTLDAAAGRLRLTTAPETITERTSASYLGLRQPGYHYTVQTKLFFTPAKAEEAGLVVLQSEEASLRFVLCNNNGRNELRIIRWGKQKPGEDPTSQIISSIELPDRTHDIALRLWQQGQRMSFWYQLADGEFHQLASDVNTCFLSTEAAGGFVGNTIGMYTSSNHGATNHQAEFSYFLMEQTAE